MEFFINKDSTLPKLKMELVNDGRNDFRMFYEKIQNATITFSMYDIETKIKKIACSDAIIEKQTSNNCEDSEVSTYYIVYQFTEKQTKKSGRYTGYFTITFLDGTGTLVAPIRDELFINVLEN
jgi:hypothetical protein|tara:strand:+ start:1919 stop:2287 length:369 start_codon:yes stop_codon:yes gene_type:complete